MQKKIMTAVEFLVGVGDGKYKDSDLKKYLTNKQGLTEDQVSKAFEIARDKKIILTSAEFLKETTAKGHKMEDLKRYLINKRGLTEKQLAEAVALYESRSPVKSKMPDLEEESKSESGRGEEEGGAEEG